MSPEQLSGQTPTSPANGTAGDTSSAQKVSAAPRGLQTLSAVAALMSLLVIAVGGATRATDSGLACPTWPGCFTGTDFLPPLSGEFVDGLGRSVTGINVWLEHSHRLLAGVLGLLIAAMTLWVLARRRQLKALLWPTLAVAVMVNVQAALGALVVWNLVQAELVTTHLALGTATMALLIVIAVRARGPLAPLTDTTRGPWRFAVATTAVLWAQILIGGHLSGIAGGLAYRGDPALGVFSLGPITMEAEAVNVAHRWLAFVVAGLVMSVMARLRRAGITGRALAWARTAAALTVVQILLGVANLWSNLSFVSVIPHLVVASWILAAMVMTVLRLRTSQPSAPTPPAATPDTAIPEEVLT